ncbi:MAG: phosphoribosylamine--glycine ligase [Candidatus Woesearchaeota archaeon]
MGYRFLFVSFNAVSIDLAWQVLHAGHQVKYYIQYPEERNVGNGLVPKTRDWKKEIDWADVIVFDEVSGMGKLAARLRKAGKKVIGGSPKTDELEDRREYGQAMMQQCGLPIAKQHLFTTFRAGIQWILQHPQRYVLKPSGIAQSHKSLVLIGNDPKGKDIIAALESYEQHYSHLINEYLLQEYLEGVEVAVGAYFNGKTFCMPISINQEHKRLCTGDLGPMTSDMGALHCWMHPNVLFEKALRPLQPVLQNENYHGYIDVNCIVNEKAIMPLEYTMRFGYPTIAVHLESIRMNYGQWLYQLAAGTLETIPVKQGVHIGISIAMPPYPYQDKTIQAIQRATPLVFKKQGKMVTPTPQQLKGLHLEDVEYQKGLFYPASTTGMLFVACGSGANTKEARVQALETCKTIAIPNGFYRTDIGQRWEQDSDKLLAWGYLQ